MSKSIMFLLTLVVATGFCWTEGGAQYPNENHYLVYNVTQNYTFSGMIILTDQFDFFTTDQVWLDKFATPVEKDGWYPIDPGAHQTWWQIYDPIPQAHKIDLDNQFGPQSWFVKDGYYLVLPAEKWDPPTDPPTFVHNHYKCYEVLNPPAMFIPVALNDQFGTYTMTVIEPVWWCNPCDKEVDGNFYPIEDEGAHLACYLLDPPLPVTYSAGVVDQFGDWTINLDEICWLCLPSWKLNDIDTEESSWGRVKSLYR